MAESIEEALQEAIDELLTKEYVQAVEYQSLPASQEARPCNYVAKLLNVKHQHQNGSTFSHKSVYIHKETFEYDWHYGGPKLEPESTPFKDLVQSKLDNVKTILDLDYIEIEDVDENKETCTISAIKGTAGNNADTYKIKVWKKDPTSVEYKIIKKTTVD